MKVGGSVVSDKYELLKVPRGALFFVRQRYPLGRSVFVLNRSVDLEYDHLFLSDHNTTFTLAAGTVAGTERIHQDVVMTWCVSTNA